MKVPWLKLESNQGEIRLEYSYKNPDQEIGLDMDQSNAEVSRSTPSWM